MPHYFFLLLFLLWISFCFAKLEIAIEGPDGWAEKLPTWRLPADNWASLLFFAGKPLTGYHVWMEVFILSVMHMAYLFTVPTLAMELELLAFFCFFSVLEDFFWFMLNPAYGIAKFRPEHIWWHRAHWWGVAPRDYYVMSAIGAVLFAASLYVR